MTEYTASLPAQPIDSVAAKFSELVAAIDHLADDIKVQGAEAFMEGQFEQSQLMLEISKGVLAFRNEVAAQQVRWREGRWRVAARPIPIVRRQPEPARQKGPWTRLRATVAGQVIEAPKAAETFATALEVMGIERIAPLGKKLSGVALVSRQPSGRYQPQIRKAGWYITTHSDTSYKKKLLEEIGAELKIPVRVEIVH